MVHGRLARLPTVTASISCITLPFDVCLLKISVSGEPEHVSPADRHTLRVDDCSKSMPHHIGCLVNDGARGSNQRMYVMCEGGVVAEAEMFFALTYSASAPRQNRRVFRKLCLGRLLHAAVLRTRIKAACRSCSWRDSGL